ncbi:fructose-2,6-bisphosphatase [Paenibacillus terrae HPL-003]|uniref:Fructose-2,6-bisphosphatase n=2 Tax=Paenibacillus terrae TaxID=159743 RepID=G7W478_PAETH|nr:fructose-2,6-bisphosphatase [Paenibacillus terrae HPL-003]
MKRDAPNIGNRAGRDMALKPYFTEHPQWDLELVLVRHGTTLWNRERRYLGHSDLGLLPGAEQELEPLREKLQRHSFARIYCSDLIRCRQTLQIIWPESKPELRLELTSKWDSERFLPNRSAWSVIMEPRLRELHFGEWDGKTYDMLKDVALYRAWIDEPQRVTPPGGEPWKDFVNRLGEFLDSLYEWRKMMEIQKIGLSDAPPSVLVVTHGGVIRQLACMLVPGHDFWSLNPKPGAAITIRLRLAQKPFVDVTATRSTEKSHPDLATGHKFTGWLVEQI